MELLLGGLTEAFAILVGFDPVTYHAIAVSLGCTLTAVLGAAVVAIPYGAWLGFYRPRARIQILILRLGMCIPTVIIGIVVYLLLSRRGIFGDLELLYTKSAIILGEFLLAFPLLGTLAHGIAASLDRIVIESSLTLGAGRWRALLRALGDCRAAVLGAGLAAFARCLTELGIAITVGGNVAGQTRTLPAAIQLELSRGDFARAIAAGIILLTLALMVTLGSHWTSGEQSR